MLSLKKNWPFISFLVLMVAIIVFVIFSKHEKSGGSMIEQIRAWGDVTVSKYKLANGLTVILAQKPTVPVFAYYTWFHVGSRHEKEGKTGIAHFFEHLLFKETKNLKEGEFDKIMEENGAATNAATWVDWTHYYEVLPADPKKVELVIRLEADRMSHMILNERQIESERGVIMNERRFRVDNDIEGTMSEKLDRLAFKVHPYGQPTIGWMEDIKNLSLEDCIYFYKTYYAPNNATIVMVGNFNPKQALEWIETYYGHLPSSTIPKIEIPREPKQVEPRMLVLRRDDIDAQKVTYAYHATPFLHRDTPALELLSEILCNGEGSRLYKMMVIDEEIASEVSASLPHFEDPALFEISVSMRKNQPAQKSHNRVFREIKRVWENGVTQKELDRAKNRLEMEYYSMLETAGGKARVIGHYELIAGDYKEALHLMKRYQEVTLEDIQRISKEYLISSNRTMVVAVPHPTRERARGSKKSRFR